MSDEKIIQFHAVSAFASLLSSVDNTIFHTAPMRRTSFSLNVRSCEQILLRISFSWLRKDVQGFF